MNISIKATNIELQDSLRDYVEKRLNSVEKFLKNKQQVIFVEIGKTTNHHKQGDIFRAEIQISFDGKTFRTESEKDDLYTSIDEARDQFIREISSSKDKKQTLFKRGATKIKEMLKGWTGK